MGILGCSNYIGTSVVSVYSLSCPPYHPCLVTPNGSTVCVDTSPSAPALCVCFKCNLSRCPCVQRYFGLM